MGKEDSRLLNSRRLGSSRNHGKLSTKRGSMCKVPCQNWDLERVLHSCGAVMVCGERLIRTSVYKVKLKAKGLRTCRPAYTHLSGTEIASRNRCDHGGRKRARNHSAAEIAGFFASLAAKKLLAASVFWVKVQNRRKLAATTAASRRSRAISRPQRPRDTEIPTPTIPEDGIR